MKTNKTEIKSELEISNTCSKLLVRKGRQWAVVSWNQLQGQVTSGNSFARGKTEAAINYVADWKSEKAAKDIFESWKLEIA